MEVFFIILTIFLSGGLVWYYWSRKYFDCSERNTVLREQNASLKTQIVSFEQMQKSFDENVKSSIEKNVLDAMGKSNDEFLRVAKEFMERYVSESQRGLDLHKEKLDKLIAPLKQAIDRYEQEVKTYRDISRESIGKIDAKIGDLMKMQKDVSQQTLQLVNALKSSKVRGRWGEVGLRRIVEMAGLNEFCDFSEQVKFRSVKPDLVVHLPEGRNIIVDSKLPMDSYFRAIETDNEAEKKLMFKKHSEAVKQMIDSLGSKKYWEQIGQSVDFVVMYIHLEPALSSALSVDNSLIERALQKNVIIATPSTFIAMLQTIAHTWRQYRLSENAKRILDTAQELAKRIDVFAEHFSNLGEAINKLATNYNSFVRSWDTRVLPSLRKISEMGIKSKSAESEIKKADGTGL